MEANVVTLETAKKLKAAGFPQKTVFFWAHPNRSNVEWHVSRYAGLHRNQTIAAPTTQELADQLPPVRLYKIEDGPGWRAQKYGPKIVIWRDADTMAEALALLWLKLHEKTEL